MMSSDRDSMDFALRFIRLTLIYLIFITAIFFIKKLPCKHLSTRESVTKCVMSTALTFSLAIQVLVKSSIRQVTII